MNEDSPSTELMQNAAKAAAKTKEWSDAKKEAAARIVSRPCNCGGCVVCLGSTGEP